ncbi:ABC-type nickel/cobalt efflux system permease component RcnA [Cytobacillus eiseniae]|uniref:ABC-type nickel/cobalt efflux system permease component RcnA n=1 Tax=Cytobacillus eiseniae TaxID=762947 RepID=A0ABS4RD66_9BACI|nr:SA1362 family protein [Cytobacillus eiseniae]MBP2240841.1 ABC-type nickel/cobalt efflux system permease component RcnA [Cytobacillus eiseniae]
MKSRASTIIILGLILLAILGVVTSLVSNPAGFLQRIAVILLVGAVIYFIFQRFYKSSPKKREQRAFIRAAKRSKKRHQVKETSKGNQRKAGSGHSLTSIKKPKKTSTHLTVIQGKKGKKKDRASL